MKKLLIALCILLLQPTLALATQLVTPPDVMDSLYTVGVDIDAGTYEVSRAVDCTDMVAFGVVAGSEVLETYSILTFENKTHIVTIQENQEILLLSGEALFTPLTTAEVAAIDAADPLKNTISGVDLTVAFKKAEEIASDTADYPMLESLSYSYFEQTNCFSVTVFVHDEATDMEAKAYTDDFIRLLNKCCMYQNLNIAPATPTSLGGIYDKINCSTLACRVSDFPDETKFILYDYIPAGTHGYSTLDMREVMK